MITQSKARGVSDRQPKRSRRQFRFALLAALVVSVACSEEQAKGPNVLFIVVDDLRVELGCYGDTQVLSPNIDRLAEEGYRFERAYCQYALCSPSRASVLTGLRPATTGIFGNDGDLRAANPELVTLPQLFRTNGYEVSAVGKIQHADQYDEPSWGTPPWSAPQGRNLVWLEPELAAHNANRRAQGKRPMGPATESRSVEDDAYPDGAVANRAIEILRTAGERPFFLAVGFYKPHLPFAAPSRYWDLYDRSRLVPTGFQGSPPETVADCATHDSTELRGFDDIPKAGVELDASQRAELRHGYLACVSYIDAQVGRLTDELDRLGLADNTIVMLWGDHGWHLGEHGLWGKLTNFEVATRVPLIVRLPVRADRVAVEGLVELVDLYPTLSALCSLSETDGLEGTSFAPLFETPARPWKRAAFSEIRRDECRGFSLRTERYRLTEWFDVADASLGIELYDCEADPDETSSLALGDIPQAAAAELLRLQEAGWSEALPD